MATSSHPLNVRLPDDMLRRVDRVQQWLARQVPGATRTDAVRMLLVKALDAIENVPGGISVEDRAWLGSDLSRLGEFEPYDFEDRNPDQLGVPVRHLPDGSFVIEGDR
jgi:hypothetical protein